MFNLFIWLSILHVSISCDLYIDALNGTDSPSCGSASQPCKTITVNATRLSLCLSPGEYQAPGLVPARMRWTGTGEPPIIHCPQNRKLRSMCDSVTNTLNWDNIIMRSCIVAPVFFCSDPSDEVVNLTITHSVLRQTNIICHMSESTATISNNIIDSSNITVYSQPGSSNDTRSITFTDNFLLPNYTIQLFLTTPLFAMTTVDIINNTHSSFSSQQLFPPADDLLSITWEQDINQPTEAMQNNVHIYLGENEIPRIELGSVRSQMPDLNVTNNNITFFTVNWEDVSNRFNSSPFFFFEANQMDTLNLRVSNEAREGDSTLSIVIRSNAINNLSLISRKNSRFCLDVSHNHIGAVVILKNEIGAPGANDTFRCNVIPSIILQYAYHDVWKGDRYLHITDNDFSAMELQLQFLMMSTAPRIILDDNRWFDSNVAQFDAALTVNAFYCGLDIRNSSFSHRSAGGIVFFGSRLSIVMDLIRMCDCNQAISVSVRNTRVSITNSDISYNSDQSGGALILYGSQNQVNIHNCTMTDNDSPHGSAISSSMKQSTIDMRDNVIHVRSETQYNTSDHNVVMLAGSHTANNNSITCPDERYLNLFDATDVLSWSCKPCENGRFIIGRGAMRGNETSGTDCKKCPSGAECLSGFTPQARGKYWCGTNDRDDLQCLVCPSNYCKRDPHDWNDSCQGDREGVLCGACSSDHTLGFFTSSCVPTSYCKPQWIVLLSLIPLAYLAVLVVIPIGDGSIWKSTSYFIQTVPLLIGQGQRDQVVGILASILLNPTATSGTFRGICVGQLDYVEMQLTSLYVPLSTLFLLFIACSILYARQKYKEKKERTGESYEFLIMPERTEEEEDRGDDKRNLMGRCTAALVTASLLVYSGVVSTCLKLLFCVEVESSGKVLYNAGNIQCDRPWRIPLIVGSAVFLIPSPLVLLLLRYKLRGTRSSVRRDVLTVVDGCYREETKYWETVYMARRLILAIAYVFIIDEKWSATVMRTLLMISIALHLQFSPFVTKRGQLLETICLLCLFGLTLLNGQVDDTDNSHYFMIQILTLFPIVVSVAFVLEKFALKAFRFFRERRQKR
ncbi:hypothetical protein PROFUN_08082 [Planoprotostelium fungivorum]|uniref:Right handed beta helix domain-containing protein n=1 Tax=Planoprotostelium fungivorum TaxID=1890364 RepID=A0A2P6NKG6_9EUKA|nr:hypothetical protein PROFUN_08082 [Planoprotostelium fungivorum]